MQHIQKRGDSLLQVYFIQELEEMYQAETFMIERLPDIRKAANSEDLRQVITDHLDMTKLHIKRLENIFEILGIKAKTRKCAAIEGLIKEVDNVIGETMEGTSTRDTALVIAAQKVEHYEIAAYGGLVQLSTTLGFESITMLLDRTLQEEKDADILYSDLAEKKINWLAETEGK